MKHIAPTILAIAALTAAPAAAQDCVNADPAGVLAGITGDAEFRVDPQDPAANLIYVANVADDASDLVVARVDGRTGYVLPRSLTTIASNFRGSDRINGPEFVQKPTGELGVVYSGPHGVHAVFRSATPALWNAFKFNVVGRRIFANPPPLPSTSRGSSPAPPIPLGQHTYGQFGGDCGGLCYGQLEEGAATDAGVALSRLGFTTTASTQGPTEGHIFNSACTAAGNCGIYEAEIDGRGDFVPDSVQKLADTGDSAVEKLVAARHPVTGSTVLFSNNGGSVLSVWEQAAVGDPLRLVGRVRIAADSSHFRAEADTQRVVLHYFVRSGQDAGSYTVPVDASENALAVGANKRISIHTTGTELVWFPAAGKWALYHPAANNTLKRCWVKP